MNGPFTRCTRCGAAGEDVAPERVVVAGRTRIMLLCYRCAYPPARRGWSGGQLIVMVLIVCAVTWWLSPMRGY